MPGVRWALHPLTTALALLAVGALAGVRAVTASPGTDAAALGGLIAVLVAGAAAGYANSGST
jgi:hypothetical protein